MKANAQSIYLYPQKLLFTGTTWNLWLQALYLTFKYTLLIVEV